VIDVIAAAASRLATWPQLRPRPLSLGPPGWSAGGIGPSSAC